MENKDVIFEVSEEKYNEMKAKGIDDDAILKPGKHIFRRVTPDKLFARKDAIIRVINSADSDKNIGSLDSNFKA
jgi:calcineurin-like phosphoesterase